MATEERPETGLSVGIEAAWGLRERPGRGPARGLDVHRIVAAAVDVADREGLPAVSMSRVASEVGVTTMALYRYISGKDDLLILMQDAAVGTPPPAPAAEERRAGLERWARAYYAALCAHPWYVRIPISSPPLSPNDVAWMEQGLALLRDSGLDAQEKLAVLVTLSGYVRSRLQLGADIEEATRAGGTWQDVERRYWRLLRSLTANGRFPALEELLASAGPELYAESSSPPGEDLDFDIGLALQLDGVEALVARKAAARD
ncbi:TetR/AcrR family transcriptional regulator [Streptomyces cacaoi]|uniref:TetR/AcrR family transcriptional regulator n=1 Tax=Streptomyces cacaoi TaxID=1898 RepID=UPI0011F1545F|nr:TetR/AcrR family transcriptional regulator [Streptomyces cacaoi]